MLHRKLGTEQYCLICSMRFTITRVSFVKACLMFRAKTEKYSFPIQLTLVRHGEKEVELIFLSCEHFHLGVFLVSEISASSLRQVNGGALISNLVWTV